MTMNYGSHQQSLDLRANHLLAANLTFWQSEMLMTNVAAWVVTVSSTLLAALLEAVLKLTPRITLPYIARWTCISASA